MNEEAALSALSAGLGAAVWALAPLLAVLFLLALLVTFLQTGPIFSFEAVKMKAENLNPAGNFKKKLLKGRPYIELARTLLKVGVTALIVSGALWGARLQMLKLTEAGASEVAAFVVSFCLATGLQVGLVFLLFGAGDFLLQRFFHLRELRMTKQEVRQELKESEGDPLIKGARRHLHLEIATRNMVAAVKSANVVVVNPTHVAVALRYDTAEMSAPVIVAKGVELIAAEIRRVAVEAGVPVVCDVPLARTLYDLELDAEIPEELYGAVATILQFVYKLAQERGEV
jgi:flagellar biosynthetic protein FlhB